MANLSFKSLIEKITEDAHSHLKESLNYNDIEKRKWLTVYDDVMQVDVTYLDGFRHNIYHHTIAIVKDKIPEYRGSSRKVTRYTVEIACGPYGETGETTKMPLGSKLQDAKKKAFELVKLAMSQGLEFKI